MLLINKAVDRSILTAGMTIPIVIQNAVFEGLGFTLKRGERRSITIELCGEQFDAVLTNIAFDERKYPTHNDLLQIRYGNNSPIAKKLRLIFAHTLQLLEQKKVESGPRRLIRLSPDEQEYIAIYSTEIPGMLSIECLTNADFCEEVGELCSLGENAVEQIFNQTDASADIIVKTKVCKIRHINRTISEDLKKAYNYRCQICGQKIGEKYSSNLIHAHHIRYFTESLNNDASNIMVVCPNHHGIIHDTHAQFDFDKKMYLYPNGYVEGLKINLHL